MVRFNIAYRHDDGEIEGFSAFRFGAQAAEQAAIALVQEECQLAGKAFDAAKLIRKFKGLSKEDTRQVKADWKLYDKQAPGRAGLKGRQ